LFGTALYHDEELRPTGVSDPEVDADNERGLIAMQWYTLKRFWGAFSCRAGWRLGDVSFGPATAPFMMTIKAPPQSEQGVQTASAK
jgi:hypothetical protein